MILFILEGPQAHGWPCLMNKKNYSPVIGIRFFQH